MRTTPPTRSTLIRPRLAAPSCRVAVARHAGLGGGAALRGLHRPRGRAPGLGRSQSAAGRLGRPGGDGRGRSGGGGKRRYRQAERRGTRSSPAPTTRPRGPAALAPDLKIMAVTEGDRGATILHGGVERSASTASQSMSRTVGCGDAFMAVVACRPARDRPRPARTRRGPRIGARASAAGAVLATKAGAMTRMPRPRRSTALIAARATGGDMKEARLLRIGVLGCGPIAQAAHFESCVKARNAELYAICDVADDLRERMAATHGARQTYADYDAMLADPGARGGDHRHRRRLPCRRVDPGARSRQARALREADGVSVEEAERLRDAVARVGQGAPGRPHEALRRRHRGGEAISSTARWASCWR